MAERVARLTPGQLDCLRLVDQHLSVQGDRDRAQYFPAHRRPADPAGACNPRRRRRTQAARIVASRSGPYQRLIHQSPYIQRRAESGQPEAAVSHQIRHADRAGEAGGAGFLTEQRPASLWSSLQPPFATRSNPRNEMSVGQRLFWIAAIAIGAAFSAGMYLAGLESLAQAPQKLAETDLQIGPTATPARSAGEGAVMRKQMIENAAYEVATQVRAVEESIEAALAEWPNCRPGWFTRAASPAPVSSASHAAFEQLAATTHEPGRGARRNRQLPRRAGRDRKTIPGLRTVRSATPRNARRRRPRPNSGSSPEGVDRAASEWSGRRNDAAAHRLLDAVVVVCACAMPCARADRRAHRRRRLPDRDDLRR